MLGCACDVLRASLLSCAGVPPIGLGDRLRVIVDKRLAAATAGLSAQHQPQSGMVAAAAAGPSSPCVADQPPAACAREVASSVPSCSGRGSVVVAAAAVSQAPVQDTPAESGKPPAARSSLFSINSTSSTAPSANKPSDPDSSSSLEGAALLAVQCGPSAVLRLSFSQLLQLSGSAAVADVADAPAEAAAAVSTLTGAAAAAATNTQAPVRIG